MNKDEMIKDLRAIIDARCEAELGQVHAESKGGKVTKTVSTSLIAKDICNANYRKIAEDEIVVKKYQLNETLTSTLESGRRIGYAQAKEAHEDAFREGFDTGKKAVAQYYLDVAYHRIRELKDDIDSAVKAIEDIAKEDGINLW